MTGCSRKNETDQVIYVKVERGTGKDTGYRIQKWINLCVASGGQIYVICDTKRAAKALTSEMNCALAGYTYNSYLTDLEELQAKKRGRDNSTTVAYQCISWQQIHASLLRVKAEQIPGGVFKGN
jgi:hypothetical protein